MKRFDVYHKLNGGLLVLCMPLPAKTKRGIKYWCDYCQSYVLPDAAHQLQIIQFVPDFSLPTSFEAIKEAERG